MILILPKVTFRDVKPNSLFKPSWQLVTAFTQTQQTTYMALHEPFVPRVSKLETWKICGWTYSFVQRIKILPRTFSKRKLKLRFTFEKFFHRENNLILTKVRLYHVGRQLKRLVSKQWNLSDFYFELKNMDAGNQVNRWVTVTHWALYWSR